jgi:glucokinase
MAKTHSIGIDIGGTKILVGLLDKNFRLLAEAKNKTKPDKGERYFLKTLRDSVKQVMDDAHVSRSEIVGVGVGCPGFIDPDRGFINDSPNIPFLKSYPLAKQLRSDFDLPVVVGNDVQTGLFGEHQFGSAKGYDNAVGIFMGTGIGGAVIIQGQPYRGSTGSAGEIGHMVMDPAGPLCGCGQRGCFEAFAGRLAIAAEAAILVARGQAPNLAQKSGTDIRAIKSGALAKAIQAGDKAVEQLIRRKAGMVGLVMSNLVNMFNPDIIVLGGGVVEAMPNIIAREAESVMRERAIAPSARHVKVSTAKLKDYSIVMGAAKRASDQFTEKSKEEQHG